MLGWALKEILSSPELNKGESNTEHNEAWTPDKAFVQNLAKRRPDICFELAVPSFS